MKIVLESAAERVGFEALTLLMMDALEWAHPVGCTCAKCLRRDVADAESVARYLAGQVPIRDLGFREPPANGHGGPA